MQETPITRKHLETLTTVDLIKMADNLGVDIPPELDRIFIIEELLDISSFNTTDPADIPQEPLLVDLVLHKSAPLPKQYNISFIEVMLRDPFWAFVFWEIKSQDKEQFEKSDGFFNYFLRVSSFKKHDSTKSGYTLHFTVPVGQNDNAWYLGFNAAEIDAKLRRQSQFAVELCAEFRDSQQVLAVSKPIELPVLQEPDNNQNPLINLSGYRDFRILRRKERLPRIKKDFSTASYE